MKTFLKVTLTSFGLLAATWMLTSVAEAKCGSHCKASKRKYAKARKDCEHFSKMNKVPCVVQTSPCMYGWRAIKVYKGYGKNYRTCAKKNVLLERNRKNAEIACTAYRKHMKRSCKVKKGGSCGVGWKMLKTFGHGSTKFRACRRREKNEGSKKFLMHLRNFMNILTRLVR